MAHRTSHFSPQVWYPKPSSISIVRPTGALTPSDADIAKRAYEKYEARGRAHGFDREDWAAASRELVGTTLGRLNPSPSLSPTQYAHS
jgi:hypothetical protein